jgi:hypothetical protein
MIVKSCKGVMKIETAIARCRKRYRLEPRPHRDGGTCWMVLDENNSGSGCVGDEARGRWEYEKQIMFKALAMFDPEHDWHDYDWHLLDGPAEERCAVLIARREECEKASREVGAWNALARAMMRQATR